jgi:hypothetical protein
MISVLFTFFFMILTIVLFQSFYITSPSLVTFFHKYSPCLSLEDDITLLQIRRTITEMTIQ